MELRALAAVRRTEKEADEIEKKKSISSTSTSTATTKAAPKTILNSSRNDVVVEEIGSDEEDVYEGRIEEDDENDPNELTDNTPETRNAVCIFLLFYYLSFYYFIMN